jgi:DNA-binding NarL/FixJ family response regulator
MDLSRASTASHVPLSPGGSAQAKTPEHEVKSTTRVLLADDHALVRAGIRALLGRINGIEVVGEAADGHEALEMIKDLRPDIALLDITMPGLSSFEVLKESIRLFPELRVIILTVHNAAEYATKALRAGAAGFLPKSAAVNELHEALETVGRGETYFSGEVLRKTLPGESRGDDEQGQLLAKLTPRQREILTLVSEGHSTRDIGRKLKISTKTVESHRAQLMQRLNIHEVAGLVRFAIRAGLVKVD